MKFPIIIFFLSLIFISCEGEKKESIKITENVIQNEFSESELQIEIITDIEEIENLKLKIALELEEKKRARLDSLPLAIRLLEYDSLAYDSINNLLNSSKNNEIIDFLNLFISAKKYGYKLPNSKIESNFFALLKNPNIEIEIMKTIAALNLNYETAFVDRFKNGQEDLKFKYFYWIGSKGTNIEVLGIILDLIKRNKISKNDQKLILLGLSQFSNSKNKNIKETAINAALLAYKNKWVTSEDIISLNNENNKSEKAKIFLKMILKNGGIKAKSIHNICLKQGIMIEQVFENLIQSKDAKTLSILLNQLTYKKDFLKTLSAIPIVYKTYNDSNISIKTIQMIEKHKNMSEELEDKLYHIFNKINCLDYLKNADKYIKDKEIINKLKSLANRPLPPKQTYEDIVNDLFALKITDSLDFNKIEYIKMNEIYQGENSLIKNILHYNQQFITIDKLAAKQPIDYDFILSGIKNQLKGEIKDIIIKSEFEQNEYFIIMIGSNKALYIYPENKKDEIDVNLIIKAFNQLINDHKLQIFNENEDYLEIFQGSKKELELIKMLTINKK